VAKGPVTIPAEVGVSIIEPFPGSWPFVANNVGNKASMFDSCFEHFDVDSCKLYPLLCSM
jgi:hypothetical protein